MDRKELEKWLRNEELRAYAAWPQEVREAWEGVPREHKRCLDTDGTFLAKTPGGDRLNSIYCISLDYTLPERAGIRWCKIAKREGDWRYQIREDDGTQCELWLDLCEAVTNGAIGYRSEKYPHIVLPQPVGYVNPKTQTWFYYPRIAEIDSGSVEIVRADWVGFEATP